MRWAALTILTVCSFNLRAQMWEAFGGGMDLSVRCLYADTATNMLYAGGNFIYADSIQVNGIAVWDGIKWDSLGSGVSVGLPILSITKYNNEIYSGDWTNFKGIARWDGIKWDSVGTGVYLFNGNSGYVGELIEYNNDLWTLGTFQMAGGDSANCVARWDGSQWYDVGFPAWGFVGSAEIYQGNLYVGGNFDWLNGIEEIAMWDGSSWSDLDGGIQGDSWVQDLVVYNGELYVGGYFFKADGNAGDYIMKWDGNNWSDVGGGGIDGQVKGMAVWNGELYVGGTFSYAGGVYAPRIAKWNGTEWCSLRSTGAQVMNNSAIAVYDSTIVIAGGVIENGDTMNNIAKWIGGNYVDTCGAIVGVEQLSINNEQITVYPNPFTESTTIEISGMELPGTFVLYDVFGREVRQLTINNEQLMIERGGLSDGVYFYHISGNTGQLLTGKLVIH